MKCVCGKFLIFFLQLSRNLKISCLILIVTIFKELPDYTYTLKFATNLFRASQSTRKVRKNSIHTFYK